MRVKSIEYPTSLDKINDIEDDNIDVFVELEDGFTYVVVVSTIKNIESLMENGFYPEGLPVMIVSKLEDHLIRKVIEFHAQNNAYWIKMDYVFTSFEVEELDEMIREKMS